MAQDMEEQPTSAIQQLFANAATIIKNVTKNSGRWTEYFASTKVNAIIRPNITVESENLDDFEIYHTKNELSARNEKILTKVMSKLPNHITEHAANKFEEMIARYADYFGLESEPISCNNFYKQKLRLKDDEPIYIPNYRTAHTQKPIVDEHVDKLITQKLVEESKSASNSPFILVAKKPLPGSTVKRTRLVFDYRKKNDKLIGDKFPLPRIDEILDSLGKAKFFSVLDLMSGFHQIELDEASRDITSFSTDRGVI